ncbi:5-carboxymethyl-2-hydroxymuconate Delta-isomerase [Kordiimonas sp.]|uniref:5-carboxymethyl-2-hydroxymuconate Delta-isomerase n=1 Tax=Kordiimonas sp. TaxID=1970157 RepID=UPI003A94B841
MPHLIIEYSSNDYSNNDVPAMMHAAHAAAMDSGLFQEHDIKVRAFPCDHTLVAGQPASLIHVTVYLLSGRDQDTQKMLAEKVLEHMATLKPEPSSLSVDCRDMDRTVYTKITAQP